MVVRLARPADPGTKRTVFHAHQKVAHRGVADVRIDLGNHDASGTGLVPLRNWVPIEILHFSFRTLEQLERKGRGGWWVNPPADLAEHIALLGRASAEGRLVDHLDALTIDDEALERGLADGTLVIDTRLRDALRHIRGAGVRLGRRGAGDSGRLVFSHPTPVEDAQLAAETAPLAEIDGIVRAAQRVASLETRLARLEQEPLRRLHRLARR
jgi:hypothetical protein